MSAWTDHVQRWKCCAACPLHAQRDRIVLARGQVPADIVFVGEAPGESENALGAPFVGPAGRVLDQIIERSVPLHVSCAFTNLVACFPAEAKHEGINEPTTAEIKACRARLSEFIDIARPKLIVTVGTLATAYMHAPPTISRVSITHPAALYRMPLVQRGYEIQRATITICNAVADMLECSGQTFTNQGNTDASIKEGAGCAARQPTDDIPF